LGNNHMDPPRGVERLWLTTARKPEGDDLPYFLLGSPYPTPAAVAIQERLALASDRKHRAAASGMGSKS
jgi:hypothetical protein